MRNNDITWLRKNLQRLLEDEIPEHYKVVIEETIILLVLEQMKNKRRGPVKNLDYRQSNRERR